MRSSEALQPEITAEEQSKAILKTQQRLPTRQSMDISTSTWIQREKSIGNWNINLIGWFYSVEESVSAGADANKGHEDE